MDGLERLRGASDDATEALRVGDRPGAYQWWYFDATSDDGEWALVVLFFVGSVFSPWYFARLAAGERALPTEHPAVNVALYRRGRSALWSFNERPARALSGAFDPTLRIGGSGLYRSPEGSYELELFESASPLSLARRVRGSVRFESAGPRGPSNAALPLDEEGRHHWMCALPRCRVTVELAEPSLRWTGSGYHDMNRGERPLGQDFQRWSWSRVHSDGGTEVRYDRTLRTGRRRALELSSFGGAHAAETVRDELLREELPLRRGGWLLDEPALWPSRRGPLRDLQRVESSPFYARYVARDPGGAHAVAEHLDLERFAHPLVQRMLPYRARRIG